MNQLEGASMKTEEELRQVMAAIEHEMEQRDIRIHRLRMALEFIRDHDAHEKRTRIYAESALEADEMMS